MGFPVWRPKPLSPEEKQEREHKKKMAELEAQMKRQEEAANALRLQSDLQAQLAGATQEGKKDTAEVTTGVGGDLGEGGEEDRRRRRRMTGASSLGIG